MDKTIPISDLLQNTGQINGLPKNPRSIKDENFKKLVKSLKDDPEMLQLRELIVYPFDKKFIVIAGNMRLRAGIEIGMNELPCKVLDKNTTVEKLRAYTIKDNVPFGDNDWGLLKDEWDSSELSEWGMALPPSFDLNDAQDDNFDIPDEVKTDIVLGDLFEIGDHRLLCGDSTQTDTFAKLFNDQLADLVVTDPPYNVAYEGKTKDKLRIDNDKQTDQDFYQFLYDFYTALGAYTKMGGGLVCLARRFRRR